ncbi:MAG TPA: D-tyrosyl-tRNA(Tyr) deacylase [Thermotogae bacterium]|nr:D-tyrosyl-tRNA(Tyr) deacylase [Thermotogota bacterium]
MRAVVQRVTEARVMVNSRPVSSIGRGLLVLLGVGHDDDESDVAWMAKKIANLRIFDDDEGKMNRSVMDVGGDVLVVSQFTLYGDARKGNRPSFTDAAPPEHGEALYSMLVNRLREQYALKVRTGEFGARMVVELKNDGPVTILLDSKKIF